MTNQDPTERVRAFYRHYAPRYDRPVQPLFDALADPAVIARLAAEAEEAGWHGVFVWDHVHWNAPIQQVADPWITMAAIATATERVRIGPMVTPLPRRRPVKVARETATLDRFAGEFSKTGEQVDDRLRGEMLDEALEILAAAVATITALRGPGSGPYDIAVGLPIGVDPAPFAKAGATWWLQGFPPGVSLDVVRGVLRDGPAQPCA